MQSKVIADVAPATNISIAMPDVHAVSAKIILCAPFCVPKEKRTSNQCLFYQFVFDMFLFNVFSIIRTVPTVKIKPVIKKISFIISPPYEKNNPQSKNRLWAVT